MLICAEGSAVCITVMITWGMLVLALIATLIRVIFGPSAPDRVLALDVAGMVVAGMIIVYSVAFDEPELLTVALTVALISFLATVTIARYLEREDRRD